MLLCVFHRILLAAFYGLPGLRLVTKNWGREVPKDGSLAKFERKDAVNSVSCKVGEKKQQQKSNEGSAQGTMGCTPNSVPMVLIGLI